MVDVIWLLNNENQKNKNIPAMKTTTYINRKDIIAFIAVIILFALMMPLKAANSKDASTGLNEIHAASAQLALFNNEIEKAVEFNAPVLSENFETVNAEARLEDLAGSLVAVASYSAPSVDEDLEVADALQELDKLNAQIEESVRYSASIN
jgi:hypothetical protein